MLEFISSTQTKYAGSCQVYLLTMEGMKTTSEQVYVYVCAREGRHMSHSTSRGKRGDCVGLLLTAEMC